MSINVVNANVCLGLILYMQRLSSGSMIYGDDVLVFGQLLPLWW